MSKSCAFLGNDYGIGQPPLLKEHIKEQVIRLINEEDVSIFYVGLKGSYEKDAYRVVVDVKKEYPSIRIIHVVTSGHELNNTTLYCDGWEYPDEIERHTYKRWCIVQRNRWLIENSDFIIAFNEYEGRAFAVCKTARNKGVNVIELTDIYGKREVYEKLSKRLSKK